MSSRIMIDDAPFGPEDLGVARQAFDGGAWEHIAALYADGAVEAARERLAKIVLSLMPDTHDAAEIQAIAVQEMTKG